MVNTYPQVCNVGEVRVLVIFSLILCMLTVFGLHAGQRYCWTCSGPESRGINRQHWIGSKAWRRSSYFTIGNFTRHRKTFTSSLIGKNRESCSKSSCKVQYFDIFDSHSKRRGRTPKPRLFQSLLPKKLPLSHVGICLMDSPFDLSRALDFSS